MKTPKPGAKSAADTVFDIPRSQFEEHQNLFAKVLTLKALAIRNTLEMVAARIDNPAEREALLQAAAEATGIAEFTVHLDRMTRAAKDSLDDKEKKALTDQLTQLPNLLAYQQQISSAASTAAPLSILAFDIDRFKSVNDTYGHPAGDAVLIEFAQILQKSMRAGDIAARIGGEEFVAVLPGADAQEAEKIAERIRTEVESWNGKTAEARYGQTLPEKITVSVGVAQLQADETEKSLRDRADAALYAAKNGGRNRTVQAQTAPAATAKTVAQPQLRG